MNSEEARAVYGVDPSPDVKLSEDQPRTASPPVTGATPAAPMTPEEATAIYGQSPPDAARPKDIIGTNWANTGAGGREPVQWTQEQSRLPPEAQMAVPIPLPEVPEPLKRIGSAIAQGWQSFEPESDTQKEINQRTQYGQYVVHPLTQLASVPFRALGAAGAGAGQAAYETGAAIDPRLGRDLYMLNQVLPALLPQAAGPRAAVRPPMAPEVSQLPPRSIMERAMTPPIEGQTTLGRAIDLLRHDQNWNNPETPGYHPPGFNPNQAFVPPPDAAGVGPPVAGVPDRFQIASGGLQPVSPGPKGLLAVPSEPPISPPLGPVENAKAVASAYYDIAHKNNTTYTPEYMNKAFDTAASVPGQTEHGITTGGANAVTQLLDRWEGRNPAYPSLRDKPATLQGATEMDRSLGDLITQEYGPTGISGVGKQLQEIQRNLRDHFENPGPDDVTGGTAGIEAMAPGRKAWSQALKMDDVIRMQERADRTQNPTQSIKTQANTLLSSRTKSRGWSDEERAALETASERGVVGGALYGLGSRLMSKVGAAAGASIGGVPGMAIGYGLGEGGSALARAGANAISARRIQNALDVLYKNVPPMPPTPPP
jgi:hypothetical protein